MRCSQLTPLASLFTIVEFMWSINNIDEDNTALRCGAIEREDIGDELY
jgi:hypothetical protein